VAALSKAWFCVHSLARIGGSNRARDMDVSVVCCQVDVSELGLSLVKRGSTECGVSECDREALRPSV